MKRRHFLFHPILIFVLAQIAWFSLLGLWIYWYISNYITISKVGEKLSPQTISMSTNITALVWGLVLLVTILVGFYLIFIYLTRQISLTKMYDNFIDNVTHELKSPLASIQLYLETLSLRTVPAERQKVFFDLMLKDAKRLNNLINAILDISRLEQKRIAHNFQICSAENTLHQLIQEAVEQFKLTTDAITVTGHAPCEWVIDRDALRIVFNNLVDNAIKYSPEVVHLTLKLSSNPRQVMLEFSDQGIGIASRDQKSIFKKFTRVQSVYNPNVKGTGLGLYWVKEIIKHHYGKITVYSAGLHQGTTFRLELPIYCAANRRVINKLLRRSERSQAFASHDLATIKPRIPTTSRD